MELIPIILIVIVLLMLLIILLINTLTFKPDLKKVAKETPDDVDKYRVIQSLQTMIRFKTISYADKALEDENQFKAFRDYLQTRYPKINALAECEEIGETGILFTLKGSHGGNPVVLMSHYDVVPENGTWKHNPFSAELIDGKIYGRGTLDTKGTLCAVMESVEHLLGNGHTFTHDLYLAFSGDEETRGPSAPAIVEHLKKHDVKPRFVLDEGGALVEGVFPGVTKKAAMIGLAEKGYLNITLEAHAQGGHASMPPKDMPVTDLAKAITSLNDGTLFDRKKTDVTMQMFNTIARHSTSFVNRMIFANLWLTWPLVKMNAKKDHGELNSLLQTTQAFTMMEASNAMNVLPSKASVGINYRILTGETVEETHEAVKARINNTAIETRIIKGADPTPVSNMDDSYDLLTDTIRAFWGDVVPTPYLMMAGTDSRYYHDISANVYRFSPMQMTKAERATIHSTEEAIQTDELIRCVQFYIMLLKRLN